MKIMATADKHDDGQSFTTLSPPNNSLVNKLFMQKQIPTHHEKNRRQGLVKVITRHPQQLGGLVLSIYLYIYIFFLGGVLSCKVNYPCLMCCKHDF